MADRRKAKRTILIGSLNILRSYRGLRIKGISFDVSPNGMRLYSSKPLQVGSWVILEIAFDIPNGKRITETISALVRWCRPGEGGMHAAGVEFIYLHPEEHPGLLQFLNRTQQPGLYYLK